MHLRSIHVLKKHYALLPSSGHSFFYCLNKKRKLLKNNNSEILIDNVYSTSFTANDSSFPPGHFDRDGHLFMY